MKFFKTLFNIVSSKKITQTVLNILGLLLIGVLIMANSPIWGSLLSTIWILIRPFFIGFVIAFALNPFINRVESLVRNRTAAVTLVYVGGIAMFFLLIGLVIPMLYDSIKELIPAFGSGLGEIQEFVLENFEYDLSTFVIHIQNIVQTFFEENNMVDMTLDVINQAIATFTNVIIYLILALYISSNYRNIRTSIKKMAYRFEKHLPSYLVQIDYSLVLYIKAFVVGAFAQAASVCLIFLLIGHDSWLIIGLLAGVSSLFPYIGPIFVNGLGLITTLSKGPYVIIFLLILIFLQSILMSYVVTPRIYSARIDLSMMSVLFGILSGSTLFGVWGMIIAMPILVTIKIIYRIYMEHQEFKQEHQHP